MGTWRVAHAVPVLATPLRGPLRAPSVVWLDNVLRCHNQKQLAVFVSICFIFCVYLVSKILENLCKNDAKLYAISDSICGSIYVRFWFLRIRSRGVFWDIFWNRNWFQSVFSAKPGAPRQFQDGFYFPSFFRAFFRWILDRF